MKVLIQLEHAIQDFDTWKAAFDRDPIGRQANGVLAYRIFRPIDDPDLVAVDLEFDDPVKAVAFREALIRLWRSPEAAPALGGEPRSRIVNETETLTY